MDEKFDLSADSVDAEDLFDVDINASGKQPAAKDDPDNAFAGIEEKLGLPFGSTKDGIRNAKAEMKSISSDAKNLKVETDILERKERLLDLPSTSFTMDDLANDRARLRSSYMRLLDRGMDMLNKIQAQLDDLVNPAPEDYAAWQKQYLACLKTLDSIRGALVTLRQEEDLKNIRLASGGGQDKPAELDPADDITPDRKDSTVAIEVSSRESNGWIKEWRAEADLTLKQEIEADHSARLAEAAVKAITKEQ